MRLLLSDKDGNVLASWELSADTPLEDCEPGVFEAVLLYTYGDTRRMVAAEVKSFAAREYEAESRRG